MASVRAFDTSGYLCGYGVVSGRTALFAAGHSARTRNRRRQILQPASLRSLPGRGSVVSAFHRDRPLALVGPSGASQASIAELIVDGFGELRVQIARMLCVR